MNSKIRRFLSGISALAIVIAAVAFAPTAKAAENIYVNGPENILGMDITDSYAVGSGGSVAIVGDTYVITDSGTVKIGQSGSLLPGVPSGDPDGTTIKVSQTTVRVGLSYAADAVATANLENKVGSGYKFGYYDSSRIFHEISGTGETAITMQPTGSGTEVSVYKTGTNTLLYKHADQSNNFAVLPIASGAKAVTWYKGYAYYGGFEYYRYHSDKLTVINVVNVEDYVKGVIPYEMSASWPLEALKAQAVCARTYFARNVNGRPQYKMDVYNTAASQVYRGTNSATSNSDAAVDATAGQYVTYNGSLCDTLYYSSNGGGSENSENVFVTALPYLRGVLDPYEKDAASINVRDTWTLTFSKATIASKIVASGKSFGTYASMNVTYSDTGNAIAVTFTDTSGKTASYSAGSCFDIFYYRIGLWSIHFTYTESGDNIVFSGGGWGHSVGMSQFGAYAMAKSHGFNYRQIIRYYYTGVNISTGV